LKLLIIEDNTRLAEAMAAGLRAQGFAIDVAATASAGLAAWRSVVFDAVILDLMLPDVPGLKALVEMRSEGVTTPVLVLTALDAVEDRVRGLDCGADDYLVKPFAIQELVARIRALLRRPGAALGRTLTLANVSLDSSARIARVDGILLDVTRSELMLLETLLRSQGRVVPKERLGDLLHDLDQDWSANSVETLMHRLRKKLAAAGANLSIRTLRGLGYLVG
jgi:DNA-binding response OmpR family regulator